MRLEKIVLDGFKSFADKTEFVFDNPITGIVGPNGCGKSNVVDAVKWVLGEQSVKSLRSGQMADVIFSGSSSRKGSGRAEVSLFIGNTLGTLPIETDAVQITRRIYKSGESEYRLNNKVCRLKDIRELFMDTGVGSKAYSIIEQGQVDRLLTSSKVDRREVFEEAAGISKYKAHKKEALRKLEKTEQNLLRLADVLGEVQKQLRSVKLAAGKARNYLVHTERLKELQVQYSLVEYHKNHISTEQKKAELAEIEEQSEALFTEVSQNDTLMSQIGNEILDKESQINIADNRLVSVTSKIEQTLQSIEFMKTRIEELDERRASAEKRSMVLAEQKHDFQCDIVKYKRQLEQCREQVVQREQDIEQLQTMLAQINSEVACVQSHLNDEKNGIIDIVRRTAQLHNEIKSIGAYRSSLSSQKDRLAGKASTTRGELERLLTEKAQYQARLGDVDKVLEDLKEGLDCKRGEIVELDESLDEMVTKLAETKQTRSALSGELKILRDMEQRREGLGTAVKNILNKRKESGGGKYGYVECMLADAVSADVAYADAVEAALEGRTDALIVQDSGQLSGDRDDLCKLEGRVEFICLDRVSPFWDVSDLSGIQGIRGRLAEFVKCRSEYSALVWDMLGKTVVVDSIEDGFKVIHHLGYGYDVVTIKGEMLSSKGFVKLGPVGKSMGLISRKSRLGQMESTIGRVEQQITEMEQMISQKRYERKHLSNLSKELRTSIYEANTEKTQIKSRTDVLDSNISRLKEEQPLIASEIEQLAMQIKESVQKEYNSKQKLDELEAVNSEHESRITKLEEEFDQKKSQQQAIIDELTEHKISLGQATEQQRSLTQAIESLETQIRSNISAVKSAKTEAATCAEQSLDAEREILRSESVVSQLYVDKEQAGNISRDFHNELESLLDRQKQVEQAVRQKRSQSSDLERHINQLRVELGQLEVKQQGLVERVSDELGLDLAASYASYEESGEPMDWEAVRAEISELRSKIERLGNVNLDAIDQQESLEHRNEFLSSQIEDLTKSKNQLGQLINKLNKQSREKFAETFEQVRLHFQELFRKLFGGGKADILLEDAEDILEAGIEIVARPPGKETRSISLLSGGEKTMTAIALLFAIFKSKPSPYCLLDEVDAALDEANNERFNLIIKEFQKNSQFIIITHSKRTMSIMDQLYGVTMQIRGVSKKISVKFDEYEEPEETDQVGQEAAVA